MNTEDNELFLKKIVKKSEMALDAIGQLNFCVSNLNRLSRQSHQYEHYRIELFHSIYTFLAYTSAISRMLWPEIPSKGKETNDKSNNNLGKQLATKNIKRRLGSGSCNLLKDEKLRDLFNKHTEQAWRHSIEQDGEYHLVSPLAMPGYPLHDKEVCYYDPISRNFHFHGETYNIQDVAAVIFKLGSFANDEQRKRRALAERAEHIFSGLSL